MKKQSVIEITARNHPGIIPFVAGFFARKNFKLEGIFYNRINTESKSKIYVLVCQSSNLEQIEKQLSKLYDIFHVEIKREFDFSHFQTIFENYSR